MANGALYEWVYGLLLVQVLAEGTPQYFVMNVMSKTVHFH